MGKIQDAIKKINTDIQKDRRTRCLPSWASMSFLTIFKGVLAMKRKTIEAIKALPFAIKSCVRWKVVLREPVMDGERLLVVDFLYNTTGPSCGAEVYCALEGGSSYRSNYVGNVIAAQKGTDDKRNKNPIYFLEFHARYPVIEFLWKRGYRRIVHQRIFGANKETRDAIRWQ